MSSLTQISHAGSYLVRSYNSFFEPTPANEGNPSHLKLQPTTEDLASVLPDEPMLDIFSRLDLSSLGASRQVCRNWNRIATDESLWRNVIYREIAFSNRDWARCFGPEVVAHEDRREELTSLPWREYIEDSRKFHDLLPGKSGKNSLMLVRLPKTLTATRNEEGELVGGLTLKSLGRLAKEKFFPKNEDGYGFIWGRIMNELGDRPIGRSCWVLMTKDVLEGSDQSYSKQQEMVADLANRSLSNYEMPATLEAAACIFSQYFSDSKTRLYPRTSTRCQDSVEGHHPIVGCFASADGLLVDFPTYSPCDVDYDIGVAALRKF